MEKEDTRFKERIWGYYKEHKRSMPWREDVSPYSIFVSEVMLQQTQVARVQIKYPRFLQAFPDFASLAKADTAALLSVWHGMGYNRRALYLKASAETVVAKYASNLPEDPILLDELPGIGQATARSITAFAYNKPVVFIETNIRRVFIHHYFADKTDVHDKEILPLVERTLDVKNPREWYWALMDYGAYLATLGDNPNKKSRHYKKQQKFKGSVREVRGGVIALLLKRSHTKKELEDLYKKDERLFTALSQLEKEGFIKKMRGTYLIK